MINKIQAIIDADLSISCPECALIYADEDYQCATCGSLGGFGQIKVSQIVKELDEAVTALHEVLADSEAQAVIVSAVETANKAIEEGAL